MKPYKNRNPCSPHLLVEVRPLLRLLQLGLHLPELGQVEGGDLLGLLDLLLVRLDLRTESGMKERRCLCSIFFAYFVLQFVHELLHPLVVLVVLLLLERQLLHPPLDAPGSKMHKSYVTLPSDRW